MYGIVMPVHTTVIPFFLHLKAAVGQTKQVLMILCRSPGFKPYWLHILLLKIPGCNKSSMTFVERKCWYVDEQFESNTRFVIRGNHQK